MVPSKHRRRVEHQITEFLELLTNKGREWGGGRQLRVAPASHLQDAFAAEPELRVEQVIIYKKKHLFKLKRATLRESCPVAVGTRFFLSLKRLFLTLRLGPFSSYFYIRQRLGDRLHTFGNVM